MAGSVLLFHGSFQYGVVDGFINGIKHAFELKGYLVHEIDLKKITTNEQLLQQLSSIEYSSLQLIFSVNGLAVEFVSKLSSFSSIPFYTYLVDHPLHLLPRFIGTKAKILCVDKEHVTFLAQLGIQAKFWPHAVCETELLEDRVSFNEKQGILFPASFKNEEKYFVEIAKVAPNIASRLADPDIRNVSDVLRMLGFIQPNVAPTVQLNGAIVSLLRQCDIYLRGRDRNKLISDCHHAGVQLTIIGTNWNNAHQYATHNYMPAVPFNELKSRIASSRFVLHDSPGFEQGQHERVVYSLARGTCVLSETTPYLLNSYGNDNGVIFYDSLDEQISSITEVDYTRWINNANNIITKNETWSSRVAMISS